jgi:hypothetical protein
MPFLAREQEVGQRVPNLAIGQLERVTIIRAQTALNDPGPLRVGGRVGGKAARQLGDAPGSC